MIETIKRGDITLSIIIRASYKKDGIEFFTPGDFSQQLGYMNRQKGYAIAPHRHNLIERKVTLTQEVLYIKSGKVRVDFYDDQQFYLESRVVEKGDVILLAAGGHGFEMLEDSEMIEVKQGPYCGEDDKVRFDAATKETINLRNGNNGSI
jgi:mannose-6-phosphate isomerase-like protein (cupin superfamily)